MNSSQNTPPEPPGLRALFTIKDFKPTFKKYTSVYKLYTPFERNALPFKQSIQLGMNEKDSFFCCVNNNTHSLFQG